MLIMLLILLLVSLIYTTNALVQGRDLLFPHLTLRIHGRVGQRETELRRYTFTDQEETRMTCVLNTTGTDDGNYTYVVHFYVNDNDKLKRTVTLQPGSTANISRTFKLHKDDRVVTCRAFRDDKQYVYDPRTTIVRLQYRPPNEKTRRGDPVPAAPGSFLQYSKVTLRIHGQVGEHEGELRRYTFTDQEETRMTCVLSSSGTIDDGNYTYVVHFFISYDDRLTQTVILQPGGTKNIPRTFKLHKYDTKVTCEAFRDGDRFYNPLISTVQLEYKPPKERSPYDEPFNSSLVMPRLYPKVFKDSGDPITEFSCRAMRRRLAILSWHQMMGNERILLKSYVDITLADGISVIFKFNRTLKDSDHDTEIFCAVRYFLDGRLSDEVKSKKLHISLKRSLGMSDHSKEGCSSAIWMGINAGVLPVSLIVMAGLLLAMLWYRKKVKEFERDGHLKTRPPMTVPLPYEQNPFGVDEYVKERLAVPAENLYEQVYGHGAGLKRPKIKPTEAALKNHY